jgi:4-amino-4-deoxy-L-arabinose transferase-like glycosyltransferase
LLTVIATFQLARTLFPHNLPLVLTATTLTALNPQFIRVSATVSNDSLSAALTTLAVLLAFKFTEAQEWRIGGWAKEFLTPPVRTLRG